jgi:arginine/lysine/ornithine decarboxylase
MGIFRHDLTRSQRIPETVREADDLFVNMGVRVPCDRCHVAEAQVEVVTNSGSVFLCRHHHRQYRDSIVAAGHLIRAWPGGLCGEPSSRSW